MKPIKILCILLLALPSVGWANWNWRNNLEFDPQYRHLNEKGIGSKSDVADIFGLFNSDLQWSSGRHWTIEVKPEIRSVASPGVSQSFPNQISVQTSRRALNFRRELWKSSVSEGYVDMDRFNVDYTFNSSEIFAGRKPITLGVLRFFPVWNKLTLPLIFQPGPEWIENPDVIGASVQSGKMSYRLIGSRGDNAQIDDLALLETRYFGQGFELQAIAGSWWQHTSLGFAAAVDALGSTFRLESLWLGAYDNEPSQWQLGLGAERALTAKWTMNVEALYQSAGLNNSEDLTSLPNRFMSLPGKYYLLPYFSYQLNLLWLLHFGALMSFANYVSCMGLVGFERSLSDNTSLALKIKWPIGASRSEFGAEHVLIPPQGQFGVASTALLQLQTTF